MAGLPFQVLLFVALWHSWIAVEISFAREYDRCWVGICIKRGGHSLEDCYSTFPLLHPHLHRSPCSASLSNKNTFSFYITLLLYLQLKWRLSPFLFL